MAFKIFKKLNIKVMILGVSACAFGMSIMLPTISWFNSDTSSPINVDGNIHGSYFESGDGTAAHPFEIARPIQLYYLSWLQEMGYFNEAVLDENTGEYVLKQQYHFFLSKDLDMDISNDESYVIPPIGTVKYPFVGSFDGNGHVITDLTISNDYSEYTKDPRHPAGSNTHSDSYEILGLFGVLGTTESTNVVPSSIIDSDGTIHELLDTNDDNVLVTYTTAGNYVQNFYLDNVTIVASTDSAHALAGAVAGYSNATVTNVGIHGASLSFESGLTSVQNIGTTNLSEYTAFGFVEPNFKRTVDLINEQVYDPKATAKTYTSNSSGTAWGGSIDMAKLLQRTFKSRYMSGAMTNKVPEYIKKETYAYDGATLLSHDISYDNRHYAHLNDGVNYNKTGYYSSDKTVANDGDYETGQSIGSYYWADQTDGGQHKAYVGGFTNIEQSTAKKIYYFNYNNSEEECYYVRSSPGTGDNFIGISSSGTITDNNSQTDAVKWHFKNGALLAHKKVTNAFGDTDNGYATSGDHETIYYLNYNGGFTLSDSSYTTWTFANNQFSCSSTKYRISYTNNNTANYLCANNSYTGFANSTTASSATLWTIEGFGSSNSGRIYTTDGTNKYFLYTTLTSSPTFSLDSTDNTTTSNTFRRSSAAATNTYIAAYSSSGYNNYYYYVNLSSGTWRTTRTRNTPTSLDLTAVTDTVSFSSVATSEKPFSLTSGQVERSGQAGYLPLCVKGDELYTSPFNYDSGKIDVENFYTSPMNTGYIVGGYYDKYNGKSGSGNPNSNNFGDVRISQYPIGRIASSYSGGSFSTLYTINDSCYNGNNQLSPITFNTNGIATSNNYSGSLNFVKFSDALDDLGDALELDSTYVSGIHFMNTELGMDKIITADRVLINNEYKNNYQMPEDSVDFKLKEKGYINFFAGNYHNDNNSFFALHKIERDANDNIVSMEKIKYIYKNNDDPLADNIYLYENGEWNDDSTITNRPTDKSHFYVNGDEYVFAFDTRWIGVNETLIPDYTNHQSQATRIYYFEIPVNDGEYALGSCYQGCGGYLIYLDISAAAQTVNRKTLNEMFIVDTISGDIPYGTQYIGSIPSIDPNADLDDIMAVVRTLNIDDTNSYYGTITPNADGTYTISRNGNTITVTNDPAIISKYIGDGMTLSGGSVGGQTQRRIRRITDYDYNKITNKYIRQITTIVTEGSGSTAHNYATTTIEYNTTGFTSNYTMVAKYSYDWVGDGPTFTTGYYLHISNSNSGIEVIFRNVNAQMTLTVEYLASGFELTSGTAGIITSSQVPAVVSQNNPYPTLTIAVSPTIESAEWTKWYDFTKSDGGYTTSGTTVTPQVIGTFKYTREANEVITENFIYSDYNCIADPEDNKYPEKETVLTDSGYYIFEFSLSGSSPTSTSTNPAVTVYYIGEGVFYIRTASGSEYILFTNSGNTQPQPNP